MRRATGAALLLFALLSLVLTYPLSLHLADAVEDRQDALLNVWITAWDGHQLLNDPLHLFDANIFAPYPRTLAYSELLLGNGLLALPITAATGNPVLGYNVALLLSFVLSGFGTYLLVLKLTRSPGAGMVAGVIFAYSSYRMTNLAQAQLLTTQWMPFALLALVLLMRQPRARHIINSVLFFCLQALSSFYYAILLALAVLAFVLWELVLGDFGIRHRGKVGLKGWFGAQREVLLSLLVAAFCCAAIVLPFALPYFQVQRELGFERALADNEPFSASLRQYLMVPPGSVLHGRWLPSDETPIAGGYPVDALFPGVVALLLAAWGLVRGRDRSRWFYLLLLLASVLLSLGPRLYLAPGRAAGLEITLPYAWLYTLVPGFKALRAPVRFDALAMLALAVLAGYGVEALARGLEGWRREEEPATGNVQSRRWNWLAAGSILLIVGLVALESLAWPAARAEPVPVGDEVPPVYAWLAGQDSSDPLSSRWRPVLELPMAFTSGGPQLEYQYFSTYHWQTTPDGYSGFIPPKHGQIVYEMERFPSERAVSLLQALGVHDVIIHTDRHSDARWSEMQAELSQSVDLAPAGAFASDQVYEVQARAFDPRSLEVSVYLPPRAAAGEPYTAYLIALNQDTRSYAIQPTEEIKPAVSWQGMGGESTERPAGNVPLVTSPDGGVAIVPLSLTAPTTPGTYRVVIREQGGALGTWALGGSVEVGEEGDNAFPVPARLEAWALLPTVRAGEPLTVGLTWRALGKIDAYYSTYVKLLDGQGNAIAGWDGQPRGGEAPTLGWVPGETIDDVITFMVPPDAAPGDYLVEVGMYRAGDLARCLTLDRNGVPLERVVLGIVRVEP